jgi:hypothetical protein
VRTLSLDLRCAFAWPARSKLVVACVGGSGESLGLPGPVVAGTA